MDRMKELRIRRRHRRQRGTTIVEAAIVLTLLMLVTLGAIEYGWMFVNLQRITNAARQGARVAAASGATDSEGDEVIDALLGEDTWTGGVMTDADALSTTATVVVDSEQVGLLIGWDLLPMPDQLRAAVTMAKEAQ